MSLETIQSKSGTPFNKVSNKPLDEAMLSTDSTLASNSSSQIPVVSAVKGYVDSAVTGLFDDRGNYDASTNLFPATGGSGTAGAIKKGDIWLISVAGTLGGQAVRVGDTVRALIDTPAQTAGNWSTTNVGFGYVPENTANKSSSFSASSTTTYPNTKALVDGLATKPDTSTLTSNANTANNVVYLNPNGRLDPFFSSNNVYVCARPNVSLESQIKDGLLALETDLGVKFDSGMIFQSAVSQPYSNPTTDFAPIKALLDAGKGVYFNYELFTAGNTANLANIKNGDYDVIFNRIGDALASDWATRTVKPVILMTFLHEFNGNDYEWSIGFGGGGVNLNADIVPAFRRLAQIIRTKAPFVKICQHYNRSHWNQNTSANTWNFGDFYAGDDLVDIVAVSHYIRGGLSERSYHAFERNFDQFYRQVQEFAPTKPMAIGEIGINPENMLFFTSLTNGGTGYSNGTIATISNSSNPDSVSATVSFTVTGGVLSSPVITERGARLGLNPTVTFSSGGVGATLSLQIGNGTIQTRPEMVRKVWRSLAQKYPKVKYINWFFRNRELVENGKWNLTTTAEKSAYREGYNYYFNGLNTDLSNEIVYGAQNILSVDPSLSASWTAVGSNAGTIGTTSDVYRHIPGRTQAVTLTHNGTAGNPDTNGMYIGGQSYTSDRDITVVIAVRASVEGVSAEIGMENSTNTARANRVREKIGLTYKLFTACLTVASNSANWWLPYIKIGHNNVPFTLTVDVIQVVEGSQPVINASGNSATTLTTNTDQTVSGKKTFESTTSKAPLALTGTPPTSPVNGDVFVDPDKKLIAVRQSGVTFRNTVNMFCNLNNVSVVNTTTETDIIPTSSASGTRTIPANYLNVAKMVKIELGGVYSTTSGSNTLRLRFKLGSTTVVDTGAITMPASQTNKYWAVTLFVLTRSSPGVSASVSANGKFEFIDSSNKLEIGELNGTGSTSINTTVAQDIVVTSQWGTADTNNSIQCRNALITIQN